jgi:hypothetical protein
MLHIITLLAAGLATAADAPVEVMVLGTYHFVNSGKDGFAVDADDVTSPRRQADLERLTDALAGWKPDRVLVEWQYPQPFTVPEYKAFTPDQLGSKRNEVIQIGFRLARRLGHDEVFGFNEQPGAGEAPYFPFDAVAAYADAHGMKPDLEAIMQRFADRTGTQSAAQATQSIAELMLFENDPERNAADHANGYYGMLKFGDGDNQAGAVLNAMWYMRNAKMFAKVGLIGKPGERVLVLVGSGHKYWLDHFATTTPGFSFVDPRPYLREAAAK